MKNPGCWICKHYCQTSEIVTTGVRNVSGKLAKYRVWSKHRCALKQEDKYPNHCDFEMDVELWEELERRYPDLAFMHKKSESVARKVSEIKRKINETINC